MNMKQAFFGTLSLLASVTASATTVLDLGQYTLTYDETTPFGAPTLNTSGPGNAVSFGWSLGSAVNYLNVGPSVDANALQKQIFLPSYSVAANAGFTLSGPLTSFTGKPVYAEFNGNVTSMTLTSVMSLDGSAPVQTDSLFTKNIVISSPGLGEVGTMSLNLNAPIGPFSTLSFNGALVLSSSGLSGPAPGGSLGAIQSTADDSFNVSFFATPVPVPPAAWLFSSALIGLVLRRRRNAS